MRESVGISGSGKRVTSREKERTSQTSGRGIVIGVVILILVILATEYKYL